MRTVFGNFTDWLSYLWSDLELLLLSAEAPTSNDGAADDSYNDTTSGTSLETLLGVVRDGPSNLLDILNSRIDQIALDAGQFSSRLSSVALNFTQHLCRDLSDGNYSSGIQLIQSQTSEVVDWFRFSEFQLKLVREFSLILAGNLFLILLAWRIYGKRISSRFLSSTEGRKVIEELRTSMSELQLPDEHDFKFK